MAKRTLPRIFERPIHYADDAELRTILSDRWRALCELEGVHLSRPVYDLNNETLLDAIARDPHAARAMLAALASRAIACFRDSAKPRKKRGAPQQTAAHYEIAERFIEMERQHPGKSETQLCRMLLNAMKKEGSTAIESAGIKTGEGVRSAVRHGIQKHADLLEGFQRADAIKRRQLRASTTADASVVWVVPGRLSVSKLVPKPPLVKLARQKKVRR